MFIVIGRAGCYYTESAKQLLDSKKLKYTYFEKSGKSPQLKNYLKHVPKNYTTVPQIFYKDKGKLHWIGGFSELSQIV